MLRKIILGDCKCTILPSELTTSQPHPSPTPTSRPYEDDKDNNDRKDGNDKQK